MGSHIWWPFSWLGSSIITTRMLLSLLQEPRNTNQLQMMQLIHNHFSVILPPKDKQEIKFTNSLQKYVFIGLGFNVEGKEYLCRFFPSNTLGARKETLQRSQVDQTGRLLWSGFMLVDNVPSPPLLLSEMVALENLPNRTEGLGICGEVGR